MKVSLFLAAALAAVMLAGCIGADDDTPLDEVANALDTQVDVSFDDPRTQPHPAFAWPTMTQPYAEDGSLLNPWLLPFTAKELPEPLTGLETLATAPEGVTTGSGIAVLGSLAVVPGHGDDTAVLDISDPANPKVLSMLPHAGNITARDVDFVVHPDGAITAIFATNEGRNPIWDLTDPEAPEFLFDMRPEKGSHNVAIVPGTPILYNANSAGGSASGLVGPEAHRGETGVGVTEIYDLTNPAEPELVQVWQNGFGCHDITFWLSADQEKYRAYCAGIEMTQIWDIADPLNPEVLVNIPVHHGNVNLPSGSVFLVNFAHLAMVSHDADVLIVGDETGGGLAMGCEAYIDAYAQTASGPLGNLYFYDLSDETNPVLKSWFSPNPSYIVNPPDPDAFPVFGWPGCTAHFGRNIEDTDSLVMAFYGAGVLLVDYSDIMHPTITSQWVHEGQNTWDAWYYQGYVFTGDMTRGFDVLGLV